MLQVSCTYQGLTQFELQHEFYEQLSAFAAKYNEIFHDYLSSLSSESLESDMTNARKQMFSLNFEETVKEEIKNLTVAKKYYEEIFNLLEKIRLFNNQTPTKFCATDEEIQSCIDLITLANEQLDLLPLCKDYLTSRNNSQSIKYKFDHQTYKNALNNYQESLRMHIEKFKNIEIATLIMKKNIYNRMATYSFNGVLINLAGLIFSGLLTAVGVGLLAIGSVLFATGPLGSPQTGIIGGFCVSLGSLATVTGGLGIVVSTVGLFKHALGHTVKISALSVEKKINNLQAAEKMQVNQNVQETENIGLLVNTL